MIKLFLSLSILVSTIVHSKEISIVSDYWCPINCRPNSVRPGYMIEILQNVFSKEGHSIKYKLMNWTRSVQSARRGEYDIIVGAYKTDAKDFLFPVEELGFSGEVFYVNEDSNWRYENIDSLKKVRLGVTKSYSYGDEIDEYVKKNNSNQKRVDTITGKNVFSRSVQKLLLKRVDVIIENEYVSNYFFKSNKKFLKNIKRSSSAKNHQKIYAAFSPNKVSSKEYISIFDKGIRRLRKSGELSVILNKYGLKDWK